jgi:biotin operon repressor
MVEMTTLFKALAEGRRLKIAALLVDRARSIDELAAATGLSPAAVARHVGRLHDAGLVEVVQRRPRVSYRFSQQPLLDALQTAAQHPARPEVPQDTAAYDQKVLGDFLVDGRLKAIPVQQKKRDVVLRYLAQQFEAGRTYGEKEVSLRLAAYHEDFATLRRALVDARLLDRKNGRYWRVVSQAHNGGDNR